MGHAALVLLPGVNTTETPALNTAGVSQSQLIRYQPDPNTGGVIQKIGGWQKFFPTAMVATVRALWAWEDTEGNAHLAFGTQSRTSGPNAGQAQLGVITSGTLQDITPTQATDNIAPSLQTTADSAIVIVNDGTIGTITPYDTVYIPIQIAVGGIVLFGLYQCDPDGVVAPGQYDILAMDTLGRPQPALTSATGGVLPSIQTTSGQLAATVTLPNNGYSSGSTFPILVPTTIGGIVWSGNYVVQTVADVNNFTILGNAPALSSASSQINGGLAQFIYSFGQGAIPSGTGYGIGGYGLGGYGSGSSITPATGTAIGAQSWTLDNYGEILVAVANQAPAMPAFQPIYVWDPVSGVPTAQVIPQAPPVNAGAFVAMPQRQIIAWGSTVTGVQDPLLIRWCDVNDFTDWIGTVINQAGQYRLTRGSRIVGAIQGPQQGIVWTDVDVWSMQYIGQPFVYSFNEIGTGCGLIAQKAAASYNGIVYWMGPNQFFTLSGGGVLPLPCPVWDVVFQQLDQNRLELIRTAVNSRFGEVSWFFPTIGSADASTYVKYNAFLQQWDYGSLTRTAWADQSVIGPPIGAGTDTNTGIEYLYQHDGVNPGTGLPTTDDDIYPMLPSFQTGYAAMSEADVKTFVDQFWPDMKWNFFGDTASSASVQLTFYFTDYPNQAPQSVGPYTITSSTQFISPRFRGRLVSINVSSSDAGSFWRIGRPRYRAVADGKF